METRKHIVRVIAAVVDQVMLTLYAEDGSTLTILQGDPRLARIVQEITPILSQGPGSVAEVDLDDGEVSNPYKDFESLPGKAIRFFMVAKAKLLEIFDLTSQPAEPEEVRPQVIGSVPASASPPLSPKAEHMLNVADEIIRHAKPSDHPEFNDKGGDQTIVAVVGDKVVADVQKLRPQLTRAVQMNSPEGMQRFMERAAAVASKRRHSIDDLLVFLERGDLPIADDGCIIIYKVLRRVNALVSSYVDCHTGRVRQQRGSYVCMDESLVDIDRTVECSNGLHVARRKYLSNFPGDVVVLAKVRPEDVIAVPKGDPDKMRVCGYHILFELSQEAYSLLKANRAFTDNDLARILLGRALAGDHIGIIEEVRITGHMGEGVKITPYQQSKPMLASQEKTESKPEPKLAEAIEEQKEGALNAPVVDPKAVVNEVNKAKAQIESRAMKAQRLYKEFESSKNVEDRKVLAKALLDHKKATKLGWTALGLPTTAEVVLQKTLKDEE